MKKRFLPIMLLFILALVACDSGVTIDTDAIATQASDVVTDVRDAVEGDGQAEEVIDPTVEPTEEPTVDSPSDRWAGVTADDTMLSLSGVNISINGIETQSDANGAFDLSVPRADNGRYVINAEMDGYLPISQIHIGGAMEDLSLEFQPVQTFTFDPQEGIDAEDNSGTQITIGANQLEDADGNEPAGNVDLNMYTYDLGNEEMVGDMSGTNSDGELVSMESEGAFYASFEDGDGTEYNLKDGETAEISIPCEPRPDEVLTVWSYDPETGLWVEEGTTTIEDGRCSAEVSHFSYWNFDYEKRDPACIKLDIEPNFLTENTPLGVKAVLQTTPVRVRDLSITKETTVLINLPTNTDVQFFMPADAATPFATINSGAPWGGTGVPAAPYTVCNGVAEIAPAKLILQSVNYPERYLAENADGTAVELLPVSPDSDDALKQQATFTQVPGLADSNMISLQTNSGAYIVATPDGVTLQAMPNTDELRRAATFNMVAGLARTGVSFESLAYPGYHLRHFSFILQLDASDGTDLYNQDASYNGVVDFVAIDVEPTPTAAPQSGTLQGQVTDAVSGAPIADAQVCIQGTTQCVDTDANGDYTISDVAPGEQVLNVREDGYIPVNDQLVTITAGETTTRPFAMSPELAVGELRIVLTWGEKPADLDSYLWLPNSTYIYYDQPGNPATANLDLDDTNGNGPETITIAQQEDGTYTYAVYNYSVARNGDTTPFSISGAVVRVYKGDQEINTFAVPTTGDGVWWYVFDLDGATGNITPVNTLSDTAPR